MDKDAIRELAHRAIANADDGIRRAAAGVNDGVDMAREGLRRSAYSNKITKDIQGCVKELEKDNKADSPGIVHDDTEALITKLNKAMSLIKDDPYNCEAVLDDLIEELSHRVSYMVENYSTSDELLAMTVMTKRYNAAKAACQGAKEHIAEEREAAAKAEAEKNAPTIVQLNDSNIRILIPDGYERAKYKNPAKQLKQSIARNEIAFRKITERSDNGVIIMKTTPENAMSFDDKQAVIDGIHQCLADNQGLIEVASGKTKRGYEYIYSIVKTIREDFKGALYFLRMDIGNESEIIEIQATFEEINMTGERDSFGHAMASSAGIVSFEGDEMIGWNEDPYDPEYNKGIPMNLSERSGLDGLFPYHPLSQAREFLFAVIEDKFVIVKKESEKEEPGDVTSKGDSEKKDNKNMIADLFAKDPVFTRHTIDIDVE